MKKIFIRFFCTIKWGVKCNNIQRVHKNWNQLNYIFIINLKHNFEWNYFTTERGILNFNFYYPFKKESTWECEEFLR